MRGWLNSGPMGLINSTLKNRKRKSVNILKCTEFLRNYGAFSGNFKVELISPIGPEFSQPLMFFMKKESCYSKEAIHKIDDKSCDQQYIFTEIGCTNNFETLK